jgi:hypothetical protein
MQTQGDLTGLLVFFSVQNVAFAWAPARKRVAGRKVGEVFSGNLSWCNPMALGKI